jgi:hypothetical protein
MALPSKALQQRQSRARRRDGDQFPDRFVDWARKIYRRSRPMPTSRRRNENRSTAKSANRSLMNANIAHAPSR